MAVTKELKRLEKSNVKLSITVPKDDVRAQYQNMLDEYTKNLQLPGFRKGKVPKEVLERKYSEALKGEAMGRVIESAMEEIFKEEDLPRNERPLPYTPPHLEDEPKFDLDNDLQFSVVYDVLPDVKIGKWKGLAVEYNYAEVDKKDIERELEEIRERNAVVLDRDENAKAQKDDVVSIDYQIFNENGEAHPDMQRKDFAFTLGAGNMVYKFDDDIIGMKKGETKEFNKKFPDEKTIEIVAGKTLKVQITLNSLKEKKLPDLDDDLAQDVDEKFKTLDDLKNSIKDRLSKNLEWQLREKKLSAVLKEIMENTPVILPESMIRAEIEGRWRKLARYYNTSVEALMQYMTGEKGSEERETEWRKQAENALHSRIILETLMEEQNIEVTDEDIEKEFERMASLGGENVEDIKKYYNNEQAMFNLKEAVREQKITAILLAENNLKQGKKENYLDFMTDNG